MTWRYNLHALWKWSNQSASTITVVWMCVCMNEQGIKGGPNLCSVLHLCLLFVCLLVDFVKFWQLKKRRRMDCEGCVIFCFIGATFHHLSTVCVSVHCAEPHWCVCVNHLILSRDLVGFVVVRRGEKRSWLVLRWRMALRTLAQLAGCPSVHPAVKLCCILLKSYTHTHI